MENDERQLAWDLLVGDIGQNLGFNSPLSN